MSLKSFSTVCLSIALSLVALQGRTAEILWAHVDSYGAYYDDGERIKNYLVDDGHSVTSIILDQVALSQGYLSGFDQVFVYDLYHGTDQQSLQQFNYSQIAQWYNSLDDQNLILDGRIISSDVAWANTAQEPGEKAFIQNYATQMQLRGGGLVLGTDHNTFTSGINSINQQINVGLFTGYYNTYPLEAIVDVNSPLYVPELATCSFDASKQCLNDNSSTSFVATGLQANGQTLTPVAYHGAQDGAWDYAAVSTTMGSITFGTCGGQGQPACTVASPGGILLYGLGLLGYGITRRRI